MLWFLIYVVIAYAVYTVSYYYIIDSYQLRVLNCLTLIRVACFSLLLGLFWILIPLGYLIYKIYIFIKK